MKDVREKIASLIIKIRALQPEFEQLSNLYRIKIREEESTSPSGPIYSGRYWRFVAYCDALVRIRILTERNFQYLETFGLLSMTRYLLELTVWMKLLEQDDRFGLLYNRMLLVDNQSYYQKLVDQLRREVAFLNSCDSLEKAKREALLKPSEPSLASQKLISSAWKAIEDEVDELAANNFSLYSDDAVTNGYSFQAYLVEKKAVPNAQEGLNEATAAIAEFDKNALSAIGEIRPKKWNWSDMSTKVGMAEEYEFIYAYTSRMLHATPISLTTDQKSLEEVEVYIMLRYCAVKMAEVFDVAQKHLNASTLH